MTAGDRQAADWSATVPTGTGDLVGRPGRVVIAAFGLFLAWAFLIPLDSAVIAPGAIIPEGRNQVLQHPGGGVVRRLHASEGELVEAGQIVVELDPLVDRARLTRLRARNTALLARLGRLEAEKTAAPGSMAFDPSALRLRGVDGAITTASFESGTLSGEERLKTLLDEEQARELAKGRRAITAQIAALEARVGGLQDRRAGYAAQLAALERQIASIRTQHADARSLASAGHMARQQVWTIESQLIERERERAEVDAADKAAEDSIAELRAQIRQIRLEDQRETSRQITEALSEIAEISDEIAAAERALVETAVRAPVRGHLVHLAANTVGGVIGPGETIAEVVPAQRRPAFEMRVSIDDIAAVTPGQATELRISALNQRIHDALPATVTYIAPDASVDETTGTQFYLVRARIDVAADSDLARILRPGMAGEAFMRGRARTFAAYLAAPIVENLNRSLREPI